MRRTHQCMSRACDLSTVAMRDGVSKRRYSRSDAAPRVPANRSRMPPMVIDVEALEICEVFRESAFETGDRFNRCLPLRGVFPNGLNGLPSFNPVGWKSSKTFPSVA